MDIKIIQDEEGRFAAHDMETGVTYSFFGEQIAYEVVKKLYQYQKDEEDGLLLRLPVEEGTIVWYADWDEDKEEFFARKIIFRAVDRFDFNKFIFLTKEEAEKECERLNNGGI